MSDPGSALLPLIVLIEPAGLDAAGDPAQQLLGQAQQLAHFGVAQAIIHEPATRLGLHQAALT